MPAFQALNTVCPVNSPLEAYILLQGDKQTMISISPSFPLSDKQFFSFYLPATRRRQVLRVKGKAG